MAGLQPPGRKMRPHLDPHAMGNGYHAEGHSQRQAPSHAVHAMTPMPGSNPGFVPKPGRLFNPHVSPPDSWDGRQAADLHQVAQSQSAQQGTGGGAPQHGAHQAAQEGALQGQRASLHVDAHTSLAAQRVLAAHKAKHLLVEVSSPAGIPPQGENSAGTVAAVVGSEVREAQTQQQVLPPVQVQAGAGNGATLPQPLLSKSGRPVVRCQWCSQMLAVPSKLEPRGGIQKLRCGKCLKISKFSVFLPPAGDLPALLPLSSSGPLPAPPSASASAASAGSQSQQPQPVMPPQQQQGQGVVEESWAQQPLQGGAVGAQIGMAPVQAYQQQQQVQPQVQQQQFLQGQGISPTFQAVHGQQRQQQQQQSPLNLPQQQPHVAVQGYGQGAQGLAQQMSGLSMGETFSQQQYAVVQQGMGQQGMGQHGMGQQNIGQQGIVQQNMGQQGLVHQNMGQQGMGQSYQQQTQLATAHMQHPQQQQQPSPQFQQQVIGGQQMIGGGQQQYANFAQPVMAATGNYMPPPQQQLQQQQMSFQQMQGQPMQQVMLQGQGQGQQQMGQQQMGQQQMGQQQMGQQQMGQQHSPQNAHMHSSGFVGSPLSQNIPSSMPMYQPHVAPQQHQQQHQGLNLNSYQQHNPMQVRCHTAKASRPPLAGGSIGGYMESEDGLPRQGSGKRFSRQPPMDVQAAARRHLTGPGKALALAASGGFRSASLNEQQQHQQGGGVPADLPFRRTATEYNGPPGRADGMGVAPRSSTLGGEGQYRRKVYVNGQPVPDKLVFLAERRIGTMEAGNYWYDCRAGFWGPMGGPAFGVNPAFMREFGMQPMQSECSGGKTKVFVNGRELHKKDLVTLQKRGFPDTPGARYTLDADGTVCNEAGRHLFAMGKLMVDKKKGMYMVKP